MREAQITRATAETDISLKLCLDGGGRCAAQLDCGFMQHMLQLFTHHSRFDLTLSCKGDSHVDYHHTVEDLGIALGLALEQALGDKAGIARYGSITLPMDEALVLVALDVSGRGFLHWDVAFPSQKVGDFDTELAEEFFLALARTAKITLHVRMLAGRNSHHIAEAVFKAFARALRQAVATDPGLDGAVPSSKGLL